jgi:hypothetical protein
MLNLMIGAHHWEKCFETIINKYKFINVLKFVYLMDTLLFESQRFIYIQYLL